MSERHERFDVDGADVLFEDTWGEEDDRVVCSECGAAVPQGALACPACEATVDECAGSCSSCGARVCVRRER